MTSGTKPTAIFSRRDYQLDKTELNDEIRVDAPGSSAQGQFRQAYYGSNECPLPQEVGRF